MKILRINNNKGEFSINGTDYKSIDTISKDDILHLIDIFTQQDCEMDDVITDNNLPNKAHLIIYKSLLVKFKELQNNKAFFRDMRDNEYKDAINKYRVNLNEQ